MIKKDKKYRRKLLIEKMIPGKELKYMELIDFTGVVTIVSSQLITTKETDKKNTRLL